jgi:hypothetical protein
MLEDIRNHSPLPRQDEIQWMQARPLQALWRVLVLASIAVGIASILAPEPQRALATIAQADTQVRP